MASSSVPAALASASRAKSACSRKACSAVPISAAVRPSLERKPGRSSVVCSALCTMLVTLTLAGTCASAAAGYCHAKFCRSFFTSAESVFGVSSGVSVSISSDSCTASSHTLIAIVLSVCTNSSSRLPESCRSTPPSGCTSSAARSQSAKLLACWCSVAPAPAARKAAALAKGLALLPLLRGTVRMSLSCARVSATYRRRICSLRSSFAWTLASAV